MIEPTNTESRILFQRSRSADSDAQRDLHDRYATRLLALVRTRLNREFRARFDAEDVVNSAFRSFFLALAEDRFSLPDRGGLWPLLAQITLHKLHRSTQHHQRLRRAAGSQESLPENLSNLHRDHDAVAELSLRDELAWLAGKLPTAAATALELSIQGFNHNEIAGQLRCTSRTIRRYLAEARALLRARWGQYSDDHDESRSASAATDELDFDDYLLRRMIGAGTFGKVYLATDQNTGGDVAIKYLRKRWANDSHVVNRFVNETNLLRRLKIAGVVPCFGGGSTGDGGRFLVMKWIDGKTLSQRVAERKLGEAEVRRQFKQLAACLQQVHAQGIIHCDLKPTNILIDRSGKWWLTDFGFARDSAASAGTAAGTPAYMAPEQLDPFYGPLGAWTDLYAVGKLILASVAGDSASGHGLTLGSPTAEQLLADCPTQISNELAAVLRLLLQRRTVDRLPSAGDLARLLADS